MFRVFYLLLALQSTVQGNPLSAPTIKLDSATVTGTNDGKLTKFLGIPFATPPARFRAAQPPPPYHGKINAQKYGALCPQQKIEFPDAGIPEVTTLLNSKPELRNAPGVESEDCLTLNIVKPSAPGRSLHGLPVVVWIHGGAYQTGDTASYDTMSSDLVKRSINIDKPIIYVSMNYRLSAYGFLSGLEIFKEGNGNLGLRDQRLALQWIHKYIHAFGGDPSKVTIWGQSSGAISVGLQMLTNGGNNEGLFRGGFLQSGAPLPVGNITKGTGQVYYDFLTSETGCSTSNDTLTCLRSLPFPVLKAAVDKTPSFFSYLSLALVWHPSVDGVFLKDNPQSLVSQGKFSRIPVVAGSCDDEGTLFATSSLNVTTDDDFKEYISTVWLPKNPVSELAQLWTFYPEDPAIGSPFGTGIANVLTPQYKRIASFIGDSFQHGPRRTFLNQVAGVNQKTWSFLNKRSKHFPGIGSYHGSDLIEEVASDQIINFVTNLDPNTNSGPHWPQYSAKSPSLYTFNTDGRVTITQDTFRTDAINYLNNLSLAHPFVL